MLSESFVAAVSAPPKDPSTNTTLLKDAGVFVHSFQPQPALRSTFKKSISPANCVAVSETHIYTAQLGKALVHVYGREKGKQEATVPFPERIHSIALAAEDTVLALGTENGSIYLWETCTGRQISTPQSHLQAVTALAVDSNSNYLLSGSADSNVLVWSLLDLLAFPPISSTVQGDVQSPRHTLSSHRDAITSLVTGHSSSSVNIAVSASKDGTAAVWNYQSGELLRTILLSSVPLCLALDPADRGFYTGYEDGSVQLVDFYSTTTVSSVQDPTLSATPVQPPSSSRWTPPSATTGSALSLSLSYDGTTLLSGHASGKILSWDVAAGRFHSQLAEYGGSPITSVKVLPPTGFPNQRLPRRKVVNIMKPRPHEAFSTPSGGRLTAGYKFTTQFPSKLTTPSLSSSSLVQNEPSSFDRMLDHVGFPVDFLNDSLAEFLSDSISAPVPSATPDFMSLDSPTTATPLSVSSNVQAEQHVAQLAALQAQVAHLKRLQEVSNNQIATLAAERTVMKKEAEKAKERKLRKLQRRDKRARSEWDGLGAKKDDVNIGAKKLKGGAPVANGGDDDDDLSSMSESSGEESA